MLYFLANFPSFFSSLSSSIWFRFVSWVPEPKSEREPHTHKASICERARFLCLYRFLTIIFMCSSSQESAKKREWAIVFFCRLHPKWNASKRPYWKTCRKNDEELGAHTHKRRRLHAILFLFEFRLTLTMARWPFSLKVQSVFNWCGLSVIVTLKHPAPASPSLAFTRSHARIQKKSAQEIQNNAIETFLHGFGVGGCACNFYTETLSVCCVRCSFVSRLFVNN